MSNLKELAWAFTGNARFEIVRCIGAGGIGLVYEALDREYDTRVALKTLQRLDGEGLLRFKSEFRLLQGIHHPNLVELGELFEESGHWFFTMELLDGVDFMAHVGQGRTPIVTPSMDPSTMTGVDTAPLRPSPMHLPAPQPQPASVAYWFDDSKLRAALGQLARGLHALHQAGMVHRDIKPHNVLVCQGRVVLLDFGLVSEERPWHRRAGEEGMLLGTPPYMAPEQAAGKPASPASDWYAVGTMLYEALTGTRPFEGDVSYLLMEKQRRDPVPPSLRVARPERIPPDLEALCLALLRRDPAARPTGAEILAQLDADMLEPGSATALAADATPLVGRTRELASLRAALRECTPGRPVVAFVHGTSGMGKTALIERFAHETRDEDCALVLRGRCYEREAVPYKAFDGVVDELSRHLKHLASSSGAGAAGTDDAGFDGPGEDSSVGLAEPLAMESSISATRVETGLGSAVMQEFKVLARLFPVLGGVLADSSAGHGDDDIKNPGELRRHAFDALKALLALVAGDRPLVVIIDDVQWGDLDSAALLSELIAPPDAPGLLLVASYRSEEAHSPLVASLRESAQRALGPSGIRDIEVGPLRDDECHALALAIWERMVPARLRHDARQGNALARAATRECAGSPFFIGEMARYLASPTRRKSEETPGRITLEQIVLERRSQLGPAARVLLDVIAVAGQPIAQGVVLRAAGQSSAERSVLTVLRAGHFVRTRGPGLRDAIEIYHDRIREAVVARMDPDELRGHHARLAAALEACGNEWNDWGEGTVELLAACHLGAGNVDQAARWTVVAAEHAERALAFDRAAQMYRMLLAMRADDQAERCSLHIRLGDALASAEHGSDAARAYLAAARLTAPGQAPGQAPDLAPSQASGGTALVSVPLRAAGLDLAVECKRRAAEQLLRSGSVDEGMALLGEVLDRSGLHVPRTNRRALVSLLVRRAQLRLRGLGYRPRPPAEIPARERQRIDVCWSGAVGLVMVDPVRGADFSTRCLLMSLRQGDEERIAKTLALEASLLATSGVRSARRAAGLMRTASSIARRTGDPHAAGVVALAAAATAMLHGRWQRARREGERAERIFREQCAGVSWEIGTALTFQYTALYYLGEWALLRERASASVRRAVEHNDLYTLAGLASFSAYGSLMDDDVPGARNAVRRATVQWNVSGYHMQNYLKLLAHLQIDLYENDGAAAWRRLEAELSTLSRTLLTRVQVLRIIVHHSRARSALSLVASGVSERAEREKLLAAATQAVRGIERERMAWADPLALLVRAGVASCQGEPKHAVTLLDQAITRLEAAHMGFFAVCARLRKAWLEGGSEGRARADAAEAVIRAQGLVNPQGLANMLVPGFPGPT